MNMRTRTSPVTAERPHTRREVHLHLVVVTNCRTRREAIHSALTECDLSHRVEIVETEVRDAE